MNNSQLYETLTTNERKALTRLSTLEWEHPAQLYVGRKTTIASLLEKGFVEFHPLSMPQFEKIKITSTGKEALSTPIPAKPQRPKLKMLEPSITILDPRYPSIKRGK